MTCLAAGGWRLAAGGWRLAGGGWRLAAGGWGLAVGDARVLSERAAEQPLKVRQL